MSQHKDETIRALEQVSARLGSDEPVEGLARFQLKATVDYAIAEAKQIEELARARPAKKAAVASEAVPPPMAGPESAREPEPAGVPA